MRICLVGNSLSHGGADKIQAEMSLMFHDMGYEVAHVIFIDAVTYDHAGEVLNLGKVRQSGSILDRWKRFRLLKKFLTDQAFDVIIDIRTRHKPLQEFLFVKWLYRVPYIITVHNARLEWYFTPDLRIGRKIFHNASAIVTVSEVLRLRIEETYGYAGVQVIHNPQNVEKFQNMAAPPKVFEKPFILAAGRMDPDNVKQFDRLIETFLASGLASRYDLRLIGDGADRPRLEALSRNKNVYFAGFVSNPYAYMAAARFTVLCSTYEGFPNVLCESLACGTPVVAFDCPTGPSEIILQETNGLLVADQEWEALRAAMIRMATEETLHAFCASNATASVSGYAPGIIGGKWRTLLQNITHAD